MDYLQRQVCSAFVLHGFDDSGLYWDCLEVSSCTKEDDHRGDNKNCRQQLTSGTITRNEITTTLLLQEKKDQ